MIFDFQVSHARFLDASDLFRGHFAKQFTASYQASFAFLSAADDLSGSSLSALSAYNDLVPWSLDDAIEAQKTFSRQFDLDFEIVRKSVVSPEALTYNESQLLEAHRSAAFEVLQEMVRKNELRKKLGYEEQSRLIHQRFSSSFKSFLYFCRAFQDTAYRVGLTIKNLKAGPHSSMATAYNKGKLNPDGPLFELLGSVPGYDVWFLTMRFKRNIVKKGVSGSFVGPYPNLGIGLSEITVDGAMKVDVQKAFRMQDIVDALDFSARIVERLRQEINPV